VLGPPAAVLLACLAGQFDVNGQVTVETRVGEAPLTADGEVRKGVAAVLLPDLQLSYLSRSSDARLDYSARIFWREPNELGSLKPVILHVVNFVGSSQVTGRLQLAGNANMSVGEADYTGLTAVLPGQAALPSVVDFLSVTAGGSVVESLSRTEKLGFNASFINRRPLGATANTTTDAMTGTTTAPLFPHQTTVVGEPNFRLTLSRRDDLTINGPVSYGVFSETMDVPGGIKILIASPQVGWQRRLTRRYTLRLAAGMAYARVRPALDTASPVAPVGEVAVDMQVAGHGGMTTRAGGGVRLDYFVDPVLGTAGPRASLTLGVTSILNPNWLVGVEASYATVFVGNAPVTVPVMGVATPVQVDETLVAAAIPVRWRASDNVLAEFGFRWADRGPSASVSAFGFHQRQLWLYCSLTATTRRPTSRMVK